MGGHDIHGGEEGWGDMTYIVSSVMPMYRTRRQTRLGSKRRRYISNAVRPPQSSNSCNRSRPSPITGPP